MSIAIALYIGAAFGVIVGFFLAAVLRGNDTHREDEHEHHHC